MNFKKWLPLFALTSVCLWAPQLQAQDYPNKPIRMVVAWPPASGIDIVMRHISEALRVELGQPVIIENRGGVALAENVEIIAHDGSNARVIHLNEWDNRALHAASHFVRIDKDAHVDHILISLGGAVQRVNPAITLSFFSDLRNEAHL
jgi:hypothetical protein